MIKKFYFITVLLLLWGTVLVQGQQTQFTVRGTVSDSGSGAKVPNVTVAFVGTNIATKTDTEGRFVLNVSSKTGTLRFTHTSYETNNVPIIGRSVFDVFLTSKTQDLNEVVVIGYGTVRKKDLTGSVGRVDIENLVKAPVASFDQALAGRVAGVRVTSTDGQPGDALNIVVRGSNSLTYSNTPLYVIDGFPMEDFNTNSINPLDIASIDILKDASATAVYGARGANGVVMITTKKGVAGVPKISYQTSLGSSQASGKQIEMLSPYEFVKLQLEIDSVKATGLYFNGTRKSLDDYRDVKGANWYKQIVRPAFFQNHNLSISGGDANTKYLVSGSYMDQNGILINSGYTRYQTRIKLDQTISKKMRVGINLNYANSLRSGTRPREQTSKAVGSGNSQQSNLFYAAWTYRPITGLDNLDLSNEDIDPEIGDYLFNPLTSAQNEYNVDKGKELTLNGYLEYDILKSLKLRITGGANNMGTRNEIFNNTHTRSGSSLTSIGRSNGVNGGLSQTDVTNISNENSLTYSKNFNDNNQLTATGVVSIQTRKEQDFGYLVNKIPNEELGVNGIDEGTVYDKSAASTQWGLLSYTGRVNYTWYNKYLFTLTMRADGSSKFPPNNKWAYFPSGAFAWKLSDEKFMKNISFISNAKLRTSYGYTGNNRITDFGYQQSIVLGGYYPFGNTPSATYYASNLGNNFLKWETTHQFDAGLELGIFADRLNIELDYYKKQTNDLLLNANISTSTGYSSALLNIGKTENSGIELTINSTNIRTKTFKWTTDFNIAFNRNKLVALASNEASRYSTVPSFSTLFGNPAWISNVGSPIAQFYGFIYDGVYQPKDFANGAKPVTGGILGSAALQPGDAKYVDRNNDGIIDDQDQTIIGSPYPKNTGGMNNSFNYKNFQLDIFLQWSYGNEILNGNRVFLEGLNGASLGRNSLASYANRWTPNNQQTDIPRSKARGVTGIWSSRYMEDGSFLRLKTISLAYKLDTKWTKFVKSAQIYARAQNLYTWTKYSGPDPEVSVKGFGLTPGFDFSAYPIATTLVLGLNVNF